MHTPSTAASSASKPTGTVSTSMIVYALSFLLLESMFVMLMLSFAKIEEKVENLIESKVHELGYILYDVEYVKEGKEYYLRIYIDNEKGISLDDCELVSNNITELLDKEDYIKEQYFMEVSSPGVERILKKDKHIQNNIGVKVQIKLFKPFNGQKQYEGILKSFDAENIVIEIDSQDLNIERQNIGQIKTIFDWN